MRVLDEAYWESPLGLAASLYIYYLY